MSAQEAPLLRIEGLGKRFSGGRSLWRARPGVAAVDGVDLAIAAGETLSLVGESGCGKSTLARMVVGLVTPSAGRILLDGRALSGRGAAARRDAAGAIQIVFQDPFGSLNPRMTVRELLAEPMLLHRRCDRRDVGARVAAMLEMVGLSASHADRYPHQFSGGQRQRIGIARALAVEPRLIVCDEAVSALDVSIQAQIVNLLQDLQARLGVAYLFIAHDLSVVRHVSHRVAVMYLGRIVEIGARDAVFDAPSHPYTRALLSAAPLPLPGARRDRIILAGDPPSPLAPPPGCRFHTRCPFAAPICREAEPKLRPVASGAQVACHRVEDLPPFALDMAGEVPPRVAAMLRLYRTAATARRTPAGAVAAAPLSTPASDPA